MDISNFSLLFLFVSGKNFDCASYAFFNKINQTKPDFHIGKFHILSYICKYKQAKLPLCLINKLHISTETIFQLLFSNVWELRCQHGADYSSR